MQRASLAARGVTSLSTPLWPLQVLSQLGIPLQALAHPAATAAPPSPPPGGQPAAPPPLNLQQAQQQQQPAGTSGEGRAAGALQPALDVELPPHSPQRAQQQAGQQAQQGGREEEPARRSTADKGKQPVEEAAAVGPSQAAPGSSFAAAVTAAAQAAAARAAAGAPSDSGSGGSGSGAGGPSSDEERAARQASEARVLQEHQHFFSALMNQGMPALAHEAEEQEPEAAGALVGAAGPGAKGSGGGG